MKVYISGKISGLPFDEVEQKFNRAEWLLEDIGAVPVNPLKNGLCRSSSWEQHMVRDIEMLLECDALLLLTTWIDSKGANIEYYIAKMQGLKILHETAIAREHEEAAKIQRAILEVTGMTFDCYSTVKPPEKVSSKGRGKSLYYTDQKNIFARWIFAYHCERRDIDFFRYFKMHRTITYHYLKKYKDEMSYNRKFRRMATQVEAFLNQCE